LSRHIVVALYVGGAALMAWWVVLTLVVVGGPTAWSWGLWWSQSFEGYMLLGGVAGSIAFASILAEGSLRRRPLRWRIGYSVLAVGITLTGTVLFALIYGLIKPRLGGDVLRSVLEDSSVVTLRFRVALWAFAGFMSGLGPFLTRRLGAVVERRLGWGLDGRTAAPSPTWGNWALDAFHHLGGGLSGGLFGASVWHFMGLYPEVAGDLYLGSGLGCLAWGMTHGLLVWGIPDDMYVGWLRVLSAERYGLRIPIPSTDGSSNERFVGHFPRGLDLFLPGEAGVAELHLSVVVDPEQRYAVRGLSQQPTSVRRFMERIDLSYDPHRPAPLETLLTMEDCVVLGADGQTVVEFVMLPREER
jgi:hypothetical protein